jgi:serine/threonine protein phosphatase 1
MILARPILGHGAGTFVDAYPLFHVRAPSEAIWNAAHNSYLQAAAELGIPVVVILFLTIGSALVFIVRRLVRRKEPAPVAIAAISAVAAVAVHSTVDFSLQFQAVGLTLVALLGAGLGEAMVLSYEPKRAPQLARSSRSFMATAAGRAETTYVTLARIGSPGDQAPPILHVTKSRSNIPAVVSDSDVTPQHEEGGQWGASQVLPKGTPDRLYVFGDVHGRLDLLTQVKAAIARDRDRAPVSQTVVVGLGDYVDRGGNSKGVIDALIAGFDCPSITLRGNHEQMLLNFLSKPGRVGRQWIQCGALETLRSYGVDTNLDMASKLCFQTLRNRLVKAMPPDHLAFLQGTKTSYQTDRYFFAHAGARPGIRLEDQDDKDLLWIKEGFSDGDADFEKVIIHGHTPVDKPYFGKFRINLDTGAYVTNQLSCLVIEEGRYRLLEIQ